MRPDQLVSNGQPRRGGKRRGLFITFEGIEGSGKTTQCHRLARRLSSRGYQVLETREPGGTPFAEKLRSLLLDNSHEAFSQEALTSECEAAMVLAARAQHVTHTILPALSKGEIVLCDRFADSTLAYQGFGRRLDVATLSTFNKFVTVGLEPDLTFLFDLPVKQGLARRKRAKHQNRLDQESLAFHTRVRKGFLDLATKHPKRIIIIDGRAAPDSIAPTIEDTLNRLIATKFSPRSSKVLLATNQP